MSASREKKQRQSAPPSGKTSKVQQEQAARKRTTIIYSVIAVIIAALVIALLVWRSGFFQSRESAATVGGDTLTTAELSFYYYDARRYTVAMASYGMSDYDTAKSDQEQFYNEAAGRTYRDYFMEEALKNAQQHKALSEEAAKAGHTESEVKNQLDEYVSSLKDQAASNGYAYAAYLKAMYGPYMTSGVFDKLYTRYLMANLAANDQYDELSESYTQADLDAYYQDNADSLDTIEYSHLYFPVGTVDTKDADGNDLPEDEVTKLQKEARDNAKKEVEDALAAVKSGSTYQSQIDKYGLTAASAGDHVKDVGTSTVNSTFRDQLLALDKNAPELLETENGFYVIEFHDRYLAQEATRDVRHILVRAENTTGDNNQLVAPTDDAWAAAKAKMDEIQSAWDKSDKTEDAFAKLANEKSDDGDGTTGGLYERNINGYFVPEFNDWVFDSSRQPGDVGMVQHSADEGSTSGYYGYHLIYYVGENEPVWMGTVRSKLAGEAQQTWIEDLSANYPTALASGADHFGM